METLNTQGGVSVGGVKRDETPDVTEGGSCRINISRGGKR